MDKLKYSLQGASIIETVTASIIFITMFSISLMIITNIYITNDYKSNFREIDKYCKKMLNNYISAEYFPDEYLHYSEWGLCKIKIAEYESFTSLHRIDMEMSNTAGKTIVKQTYLINYKKL